jgi:hypothetical protein
MSWKKICWDFAHALLELAVWLQGAAKRIKKAAVVPLVSGPTTVLKP